MYYEKSKKVIGKETGNCRHFLNKLNGWRLQWYCCYFVIIDSKSYIFAESYYAIINFFQSQKFRDLGAGNPGIPRLYSLPTRHSTDQWLMITKEICYTWDAVTSVNLNISMVRYLRRHLVCTVHCLHEQEWWLLMRWSCEKSWQTSAWHWQLPIRNSEKWLGRWYEAVSPVTFHDVCYLIVAPVDFTG